MINDILPPDFNWKIYVLLNNDIRHIKDKTKAIEHYLNHGKKEKRIYNMPSDFNWKTYIFLNNDIHHITEKEKAIKHYLNHGIIEKRLYKFKIPFDFNWKTYISLNSDIKHITDQEKAINHYLNHGITEKRLYKIVDYNKDLHNSPNNNLPNNNEPIITRHDNLNTYSCLDEKDVLFSKLHFEKKYKQYDVNNDILDTLDTFILVIDFNNGGGGTTIFLNMIVSKFKKHQTFVIARNCNGELHININEEYILDKKYNTEESLQFIEKYKAKISQVFVNHLLSHDKTFINKLFTITTIMLDFILIP